MLVVHGMYSWSRKRVGYRNDYCLTCNARRLAYQHRTFDVYHLYWIPLLPLGVWKRWRCSVCGSDPHASTNVRPILKWAGIGMLALMTLSSWMVSPVEKPEDRVFIWAVRIGGPIALGWAIRATVKSPPGARLEDLLRTVPPIMDAHCPQCAVMLLPEEPAWRCPQCGLARRSLPVS